jgi:hypothetical protein
MAAFLAPLIGTGVSALAGLFGAKPKPTVTTTNSNSTTNATGSIDNTSQPILNDSQQMLANLFTGAASNQFKNGAPDLSSYTANGLQNINKAADIRSKTASNILASRGLSFSPSGVQDLINPESDRLAQSTQFLSQIPLLKRQFQQQNIQGLMDAFKIQPFGQQTNGTSDQTSNTQGSSTQTGTTQGNPVAGTLSGAGQGLFASLPYLTDAINKNNGTSPNPIGADGQPIYGRQ